MKKLLIFALLFCAKTALADEPTFLIEIKDHRFEPSVLVVPANQKFFLIVKNLDKTAEEFESETLQKEKIVKGEKEIKLPIKPLKPGEYPFFGEFHAKSAQGKLIAK